MRITSVLIMKRFVKIALIAAAVLALIEPLFFRILARKAVVWAVGRETGLNLEIGRLKMGKLGSWFEITDFRLMNPEGFEPGPCVEIARLHVRYSPRSLFSDTLRIPRLYLDIPRVLVVEEGGASNLDPLVEKTLSAPVRPETAPSAHESRPAQTESYSSPPPATSNGRKNVSIGELTLKLGTLELRRRAADEDEPVIQEFVFNETVVLTNVVSPEQVVQRVAAGFLVKQMASGLLEP